jgi:4-amino-4-deoxy-L-arabinose transferase-like glycosyltransferase
VRLASAPAVVSLDVAHVLRKAKWFVVCWIVLFWRLGYPSLLDPDEAHYAQLTHEMLRGGSWLVPLLDGHPYIDKPVFFHWLQALAVLVVGESELAMRLPSALAAISLFATTRWVGVALMGERVGETGALMFATIPITFALGSIGLFDMVFTAFLFGAIGTLCVSAVQRRPRLQYVGYVLLTLAVMTKGPVALVLVVFFGAIAFACGREARDAIRFLDWPLGLALVSVGAAPWFAWMFWQFDGQFVRDYLLAGNVFYLTKPTSYSARVVRHTFYLRTFIAGFFPWSLVVLGRGVDVIRHLRQRWTLPPGETLMWAWTIAVIGLFSVARFKLDHYIFPAAPACCLLAARGWQSTLTDRPDRSIGTRISILVLGVSLVAVGIASAVALWQINLGLSELAALMPIALTAGGAVLMWQMLRNHLVPPQSLRVLIVMLLVVYATTVAVGFPVLERTRPTARAARWLKARSEPTSPVAIYRLERWRASLRYYVGRPVESLQDPDTLRAFLNSGNQVYVVMLRKDFDELRANGVEIHSAYQRSAVTSTSGRGFRRQHWGRLVIATNHRLHPKVIP